MEGKDDREQEGKRGQTEGRNEGNFEKKKGREKRKASADRKNARNEKKIKKRKKGKVITEEVYVIKTRGKGKRCRRRERGKCEEGKEKEWLRKMRRESSN